MIIAGKNFGGDVARAEPAQTQPWTPEIVGIIQVPPAQLFSPPQDEPPLIFTSHYSMNP